MAIIHGEDRPTGTEAGPPIGGRGRGWEESERWRKGGGGGLVTLPNLNMTTESANHGDGLAFGFGLAQSGTTTLPKCFGILLFCFSTYYDTFTVGLVVSANILFVGFGLSVIPSLYEDMC